MKRSKLKSNNKQKYLEVSDDKFRELLFLLRDSTQQSWYKIHQHKEINFHVRHSVTGDTLLHTLVQEHDTDQVLEFLVKQAQLDINAKNNANLAPIHIAASESTLDRCKLLGDLGAELHLRGGSREKPVHPVVFAVQAGKEPIAVWFLENHYKSNEFDSELFEAIVNKVPSAAGAFMDLFSKDVGGGNYFYTKGSELYGSSRNQGPLHTVMKSDQLEASNILSHRTFHRILNVKWKAFARQKFLWEVLVYFFLVLSFTLPNILWVDVSAFQVLEDSQWSNVFNFIFRSSAWSLACYHLYFIELQELISEGYRDYLRSYWNWINVITYLFILISIPLEYFPQYHYMKDVLLAIVSVLLWMNLLQFAQINETLGVMVVMMGKMLKDIFKLLFLFFVIQIGFAGGFFYVFHGKDGYQTFFDAWVTVFLFMFGQMEYKDQFYNAKKDEYYAGMFLLISYMILVTTILYNILIALMASTYSEIQEASDSEAIRVQTGIMMKFEKKMDETKWNEIKTQITRNFNSSTPKNNDTAVYGTFQIEKGDSSQETMSSSIQKSTLPCLLDGIEPGNEHYDKMDINAEIPKLSAEISSLKHQIEEILNLLTQLPKNSSS